MKVGAENQRLNKSKSFYFVVNFILKLTQLDFNFTE